MLCEEGVIQGVFKLSDVWVIFEDAVKPDDKRRTKKSEPQSII